MRVRAPAVGGKYFKKYKETLVAGGSACPSVPANSMSLSSQVR